MAKTKAEVEKRHAWMKEHYHEYTYLQHMARDYMAEFNIASYSSATTTIDKWAGLWGFKPLVRQACERSGKNDELLEAEVKKKKPRRKVKKLMLIKVTSNSKFYDWRWV